MQAPFEKRKTEQLVHSALGDFQAQADHTLLGDMDIESATSFLKVFLDAAYRDLNIAPDKLDAEQMKEIILGRMPTRIGAGRKDAERAVDVVECYYQHLKEDHKLAPPKGAKKVFTESRKKFPALLAEGKPAEGVNTAVEALRREEVKVGRNDPCPCGSGKKYKKCCGKAA